MNYIYTLVNDFNLSFKNKGINDKLKYSGYVRYFTLKKLNCSDS